MIQLGIVCMETVVKQNIVSLYNENKEAISWKCTPSQEKSFKIVNIILSKIKCTHLLTFMIIIKFCRISIFTVSYIPL